MPKQFAWRSLIGFASLILAVTLITISGASQTTNPAYLAEMPSVDRVKAEIKGSDPIDTSARQMAAFTRLQDIIKVLAGPRFIANEFTPDEQRFIGRYFNVVQR